MKKVKKLTLIQLVRLETDSRVWAKAPDYLTKQLEETGDCAELERAMSHEYPGWFVVKWATVPKDDGERMLCHGLEEIFQFNELF